jgi:hypothetical protein
MSPKEAQELYETLVDDLPKNSNEFLAKDNRDDHLKTDTCEEFLPPPLFINSGGEEKIPDDKHEVSHG